MHHNLVTLFQGADIKTRKQNKNNVQCRQMKMIMWNEQTRVLNEKINVTKILRHLILKRRLHLILKRRLRQLQGFELAIHPSGSLQRKCNEVQTGQRALRNLQIQNITHNKRTFGNYTFQREKESNNSEPLNSIPGKTSGCRI